MTRYTPGQCENPQKEIDRMHAEIRRLREEKKQALTELAKVKADRDKWKNLVDEIIRHNGFDFELPGEA